MDKQVVTLVWIGSLSEIHEYAKFLFAITSSPRPEGKHTARFPHLT